ncbi:NAD(P)-binding protein [Mytilinidion resinicola]|uniref:NAD(P)-binding protein n=1 Tax=Mytilinidion resinicola TaxID=574789 RepID=A0A6A6XXX8_9PEZI|nr:NAD(P)-binding protein [Mytilinidion resinicola]KAF2801406.1 NAD(P)-binding protein [Mytilinidion resinicola]
MASPHPFAGKVIAITGAASGIGLSLATYLAIRDATLSLADINDAALATASASILAAAPGTKLITTAVNVRSAASVRAWISGTVEKLGPLDGAANIAGVLNKTHAGGFTAITEVDDDEWDFLLAVNLTGVMYCMREELKVIKDGGSVVNASSIAGLHGAAGGAAYTASKHGVVGLTKSAAKDPTVASRGVRVNCFCPAMIQTPMADLTMEIYPDYVPSNPLGRIGKAEEVASLAAFLLGDESRFITGVAYSIDGGELA